MVNSGGGDPAAALARAGLEVPVVNSAGTAVRRRRTQPRHRGHIRALRGVPRRRLGRRAGVGGGSPPAHADGADVVACVIASPPDATRSANAAHLLLNRRRLPGTPPTERLLFGLSYDRALFDRFGPSARICASARTASSTTRSGSRPPSPGHPTCVPSTRAPPRPREFLADQRRRGRRRAEARPPSLRARVGDQAGRRRRDEPDDGPPPRPPDAGPPRARGADARVADARPRLAGLPRRRHLGPRLVRITFLGHAGLFIETAAGTVLCDPWFNPAYFGAWFPFPSNENIDPEGDWEPGLPLRLALPPRPPRPALPRRARVQGRDGGAAGLSGRPSRARAEGARVPLAS